MKTPFYPWAHLSSSSKLICRHCSQLPPARWLLVSGTLPIENDGCALVGRPPRATHGMAWAHGVASSRLPRLPSLRLHGETGSEILNIRLLNPVWSASPRMHVPSKTQASERMHCDARSRVYSQSVARLHFPMCLAISIPAYYGSLPS